MAYHNASGYVKVASSIGQSITLTKTPATPFIKFVNGLVHVAYNHGGQFAAAVFNPYSGEELGEESVNGQGFIDLNGYAVVLEGLTPGSLIRVYRVNVG